MKNDFWNSLNKFRGTIEISSLKNYLLTLVFLKFLTEETKKNEDFQFSLPVELNFDYLIELANNPYLGDGINKMLRSIVELHPTLRNVIDYNDFNDITFIRDSRTNTEALRDLIGLIHSSDKSFDFNNSAETNIWADLFDSIVLMFAELSGKSFLDLTTPKEVNLVISKLLDIKDTKDSISIYDPTCGNGNSFISIAENYKNHFNFFGQEINNELVSVAKMNMIIHKIASFEILEGDVLNNPKFIERDNQLKKFDYVVSNPPFGVKNWNRNSELDYYNRWNSNTGIPLNSNADLAFVLHALESLKVGGKAIMIVPHGVLFRGGAELNIRKYLIQIGYIKGIIGLPSKLYFGTGIPSCMIILEKSQIDSSDGVFLVDASSEFVKDNFTNKLTAESVNKIIDTWSNQIQVSEFSRFISKEEIIENDYNLNIPRYLSKIENFQISEGSMLKELNDILVSVRKIRPSEEFGKIIRISDLADNPFLFNISFDSLQTKELNRSVYMLNEPALLISKRFNKLKPSFCFASVDNPVYVSPEIEALSISDSRIDLAYLILQLNSDYVVKQAESFSVGAAMPSLSRQDIFKLKIIVPDLNLQESIIRQKALVEGAKIQSDKSKIEAFQLQNTIDTLLKERMNDFQWTLHDLRNGDLLSIKNKVSILLKISKIDEKANNIIIDSSKNVNLPLFINKLAENVTNLSKILADMFDDTNEFGIKERLNLFILINDFIQNQNIIDKEIVNFNLNDLNDLYNEITDDSQIFVEFNKKDFLKICTNIFENIKRHAGFKETSNNLIKLNIELDKSNGTITFSFLNNGIENNISQSDFFSNGGRKGINSNTGKGGYIIKQLALRNEAIPFQNSYETKSLNDFAFEVGLTLKYFYNEI
jgi:type I restriction system adenine methylase HsdM